MCTGAPFSATWAGCGGTAHGSGQGRCGAPASWVGLKFFRYPRPVLYRAFACDEHVEQLDVARPIDDSGRAEIERRRERHRRVVVDGYPYEPEPALAAGAQARARLDEARRYAEGRPGWRVSSERGSSSGVQPWAGLHGTSERAPRK